MTVGETDAHHEDEAPSTGGCCPHGSMQVGGSGRGCHGRSTPTFLGVLLSAVRWEVGVPYDMNMHER